MSITVGGNASKNQGGFQLTFEGLVDRLKKDMNREK